MVLSSFMGTVHVFTVNIGGYLGSAPCTLLFVLELRCALCSVWSLCVPPGGREASERTLLQHPVTHSVCFGTVFFCDTVCENLVPFKITMEGEFRV